MNFVMSLRLLASVSAVLLSAAAALGAASADQQQWLAKAKRFERHGWTYLHIEGEPRQRGFQHGYLLAREIADGLRSTRDLWEHDSAMPWSWLVERTAAMFTNRIDAEGPG